MRAAVIVFLAALTGACGVRQPQPAARTARGLSEGYALLYELVSTQRFADKILLVKLESDDVDHLVTRIAKHSADVKGELERIADGYPAIRLDPEVLPEVERRMREAFNRQKVKNLLGSSGKEFERTLLVTAAGLLEQERQLAGVMVDAETDRNRRHFWEQRRHGFDAEFRDVLALLERRYFR